MYLLSTTYLYLGNYSISVTAAAADLIKTHIIFCLQNTNNV